MTLDRELCQKHLLHDGVEPRFKILNRIGHGAFGEVSVEDGGGALEKDVLGV